MDEVKCGEKIIFVSGVGICDLPVPTPYL